MNAFQGMRDRLQGLGDYLSLAAIVALALAAAAIFLWLMYDGRGMASAAQRDSLLSTLLLADIVAFVVTAIAALLCLYASSLFYGDFRGAIGPDAFAVFLILMLAPIAFIAGDIAWKPPMLADYETFLACSLSALAVLSGVSFIAFEVHVLRPRERVRALVGRVVDEHRAAGATATAASVSALQPPASGPSLLLSGMLKRLAARDPGPVLFALDQMSRAALEAARGEPDARSLAVAGGMVSRIVEAGAAGAAAGSEAIPCRAIERLKEIATQAEAPSISAAAFRGIGYASGACAGQGSGFLAGAVDPWIAGLYLSIYDETGRREALDKAVAIADRALSGRDALTVEERAQALYASGRAYQRLAEADRSEEKALLAISRLDEARASVAAGPLDAALVDLEIGRAYVALAPLKNPIKSYRKALSLYEEAGRTLAGGAYRFDAAALEARQGHACAMLADEYHRARRYDDALASARTAIERYRSAAAFFTPGRSPEQHSLIMSGAGLAHALISEMFARSREFDGALKHARMAIDCYSTALEAVGKERAPEGYASLKVGLGVAQVGLAEICFREKRYDEAIAACDSAIAAYNEALRVYESAGKEKQAGPARKNLKEATDLFNTFMMIGSGKARQAELGDAP